jgi:hypothetical protein
VKPRPIKLLSRELGAGVTSIICLFNITIFAEFARTVEESKPKITVSCASKSTKSPRIWLFNSIGQSVNNGEYTAVPGRQFKYIKSTMPRAINLLRASNRCLKLWRSTSLRPLVTMGALLMCWVDELSRLPGSDVSATMKIQALYIEEVSFFEIIWNLSIQRLSCA